MKIAELVDLLFATLVNDGVLTGKYRNSDGRIVSGSEPQAS